MKTDKYAHAIAGRLIKQHKPREMWEGTNSSVVRFMTGYLPGSVAVCNYIMELRSTLANFN
jgi:hypothetical protein